MELKDAIVGGLAAIAAFFGGLAFSCWLKPCATKGDIEVTLSYPIWFTSIHEVKGTVIISHPDTGIEVATQSFEIGIGKSQTLKFLNIPFGYYDVTYSATSDTGDNFYQSKRINHYFSITKVDFIIAKSTIPLFPLMR